MASTMPTLMTPAILLLHSYYFLLGFDIAAKRHAWNSNTVHETCRYATINHSHQSPPPPPPHISYILLLINGRSLFVGFFNIDKTRDSAKNAVAPPPPAAVVVVVVVVVGVVCGGGDCCESCCCCNGTVTVVVVPVGVVVGIVGVVVVVEQQLLLLQKSYQLWIGDISLMAMNLVETPPIFLLISQKILIHQSMYHLYDTILT